MTGLRITAACSLCGHEYARWFDEAASAAHMAEAHDMYLVPGSPRPGDLPRWELRPPGTR